MEKIYFHNQKNLENKIEKIKEQGLNKLHIVSDFDRTLTRATYNAKKIPSGIALVRQGDYLSNKYPQKAFTLFNKYHPIEIDENLDYQYRCNKMQEWWEEHEKLLVKSKMHKNVIADILEKNPKLFRDGSDNFFDFLYKKKVPLLIFSAGIGNLIKDYLKKKDKLTDNIHIIANTFVFNFQGYATGYEHEVIHTLNKSEIKIKNKNYKKMISERNNVILLGDSLGDLGMVNDLNTNCIIKIGFLNKASKSNLELYKTKFDIVIANDGSMKYVNKLLQKLTK
jgi:5'-nucleotidase